MSLSMTATLAFGGLLVLLWLPSELTPILIRELLATLSLFACWSASDIASELASYFAVDEA